jgi:hypothetical protein
VTTRETASLDSHSPLRLHSPLPPLVFSPVSASLHSDCADLVLDEQDHAYTVVCDYNSLACFTYGWDLSVPSAAAQLPWSPQPLVKGAFPRILELYTMGLFYAAGKVFFPLSYTLSGSAAGVAVIDTATGTSSMQLVGAPNINAGATGTALLPSGNVVAMLSYTNGRDAGASMAALDGQTGTVVWTSTGITRQDIDQPVRSPSPSSSHSGAQSIACVCALNFTRCSACAAAPPLQHPLVDPYGSGSIYAMTFQNLAPSPTIQLLCVNSASGLPCAGYPANGTAFLDDFDNFTARE